MKLAILADIHANYIALQAVAAHLEAWHPDHIIVAGDVVNRGPRPRECLEFVETKRRTANWQILRGNHEDYVCDQAESDQPRPGPKYDAYQMAYWTGLELGPQLDRLDTWPNLISLDLPQGEVRIAHASMRHNRDGLYPETDDATMRDQIEPPPAVFAAGHTHRPLVRRLDKTLVVNVGSAGIPFDGDTRPSYAQITWQDGRWQAEIIRVEYDFSAALAEYASPRFQEGCGPISRLVYDELKHARPRLYAWARDHMEAILNGDITVSESVDRTLAHLHHHHPPKP